MSNVIRFPQGERLLLANHLHATRPDWPHDEIMRWLHIAQRRAATLEMVRAVALECAAVTTATPEDIDYRWDEWTGKLVRPPRGSAPRHAALFDAEQASSAGPTDPRTQSEHIARVIGGGEPATPEQRAARKAEADAIIAAAKTRRLAEQAAKDAEREAEREARRRQA